LKKYVQDIDYWKSEKEEESKQGSKEIRGKGRQRE
jgi:hypothetical protein